MNTVFTSAGPGRITSAQDNVTGSARSVGLRVVKVYRGGGAHPLLLGWAHVPVVLDGGTTLREAAVAAMRVLGLPLAPAIINEAFHGRGGGGGGADDDAPAAAAAPPPSRLMEFTVCDGTRPPYGVSAEAAFPTVWTTAPDGTLPCLRVRIATRTQGIAEQSST